MFQLNTRAQAIMEEQYLKEDNARLDFYFEQKAAKEGKTFKPVIKEMPYFVPLDVALRLKKVEMEKKRKIKEEVAKFRTRDQMKPIDGRTRSLLYAGVSKEQEGRHRYLHDRVHLLPEKRYNFPVVSSFVYGWNVAENEELYRRPTFANVAKIEQTFYSRNGVSMLSKDKTACEMTGHYK